MPQRRPSLPLQQGLGAWDGLRKTVDSVASCVIIGPETPCLAPRFSRVGCGGAPKWLVHRLTQLD